MLSRNTSSPRNVTGAMVMIVIGPCWIQDGLRSMICDLTFIFQISEVHQLHMLNHHESYADVSLYLQSSLASGFILSYLTSIPVHWFAP